MPVQHIKGDGTRGHGSLIVTPVSSSDVKLPATPKSRTNADLVRDRDDAAVTAGDNKPPDKPAAKRVRKPKSAVAPKTPPPVKIPADTSTWPSNNAPGAPAVPTFIESAPRLFGRPIEWAGVDKPALLKRLSVLGWVPKSILPTVDDNDIHKALLAYQKFFGLHAGEGYPDPETMRSIFSLRFCGHPDVLPLQSGVGRWSNPNITWTMQVSNWPRLGTAAAIEAFKQAWQSLQDVCGINVTYVTDKSQACVVTSMASIDGAFGVLAISQLPGPNNTMQLTQQFDQAEAWADGETVPNGQIDIQRVAAHECMHALGVPHVGNNNLISPIYNPSIRRPVAGDIAELQGRYGPSKNVTAAPTPTSPSGVPTWITIQDAAGKPISQYRIQTAG